MIGAGDAVGGKQCAAERAEAALHAVADHRIADLLGHRDAEAHRRIAVVARAYQKHEAGHGPARATVRREEIRAAPEDDVSVLAQAESDLRPRARRAARTLRPLGVAERVRKPWRRLRTRLLGWKVRFIGQSLGLHTNEKGPPNGRRPRWGVRIGKMGLRVNPERTPRAGA